MDRVALDHSAQAAVAAYIEYENIVGGADGGKLLSPEEYEEFKRNIAAKRVNRLFVYWRNQQGTDCKTVGPYSTCFCGHRYRQHQTDDNVTTKKVPCKTPKCRCRQFSYVPVYGSNDLKCLCKHSFREHNPQTKTCERPNCRCQGFSSTHSCTCSQHYNTHSTVFESREERLAMGRPVDNFGGGGELYAAMGGVTDFASLVDGADREAIGPMLQQGPDGPTKAIRFAGQNFEASGASRRAIEGPRADREERKVVTEDQPSAFDLYHRPHRFARR